MEVVWIVLLLGGVFALVCYAAWRESKVPPCCSCEEKCGAECPCKGECTKCKHCLQHIHPMIPY